MSGDLEKNRDISASLLILFSINLLIPEHTSMVMSR